jgi:glycosyltransferase involved in cell wall biosynthesis
VINDLGIGGAQRILADVVLALPKDQFELSVINLNLVQNDEIERELQHAGIVVFRCPFRSKKDVRRFLWLFKTIKKINPDILHSHLWFSSLLTALIGRAAGCKKVVSTEHNTTTFDTRPGWYMALARMYLKMNQAHCAVSKAIEAQIRLKNPDIAHKTRQIYNGIDTTLFAPDPEKELKRPTEFLRIGTLVRDDPRKGFSVFVNAALQAADKKLNVKFMAAYWTTPGQNENIDYVHINGSRESVADYMRSLDVFVLPSFEEGLGLVLLEAMASGTAVLASNIGGILEIINDDKNGLLFQVGDSKELLEKLNDLISNPNKMKRLAQQGREDVVERFSLNTMVNAYTELYNRLMDDTDD